MYGYGYRYNSGLVLGAGGGAPFLNTYSLDFDGVDDYVNVGADVSLDIFGGDFTISLWAKWGAQTTSANGIINFGANANKAMIGLGFSTQYGKITFGTRLMPNGALYDMGSGYDDNQWHNIVCILSGTTRTVYVDGVDITSTALTANILMGTTNDIGVRDRGSQNRFFVGNIDECSIWDSAISIGDVWDGSGEPTDLSLLATPPTAWYRMGDNGAWKSPQWLLPNNENFTSNKVSNYSFELDGIDDYIDCGDSNDFSFGDGATDSPFSVSAWVKINSFATNNVVFSKDSGLPNREYAMGFFGGSKKLRFYIKDNGGNNQQSIDSTTLFAINTWYNITCTYDGSGGSNAADGMNIYVNSVLETPTNVIKGTYTAMSNTTAPVNIGRYGAASSVINAKVDDVSLYASELSASDVTDIYNGGEPTTISGAIAHYKMGEEATFSGVWTIADQVGTNNGTSNGMNIFDRVGEAPNSTSNAVSFNMDEVDRVTDTP